MSDQTLSIDIALAADATRQSLAQLADAPAAPATVDGDPLDELRQLKAELRLHTQLLQALVAKLDPLLEFVLADE